MEAFEPGTRIADKYQLVRPIGRGGMGEVWEAVNEGVGKRVAIKLLEPSLAKQPEFMRRFELEAQASALIDHPDIVDVLDTGTTEQGAPYMVMEFLQGITLRQLHKKFKALTLEQTVAVIAPVLDALAAAHAAGIIHRDLKPANIFLAVKPRPSVKILDFGISKFQQSEGMTKTGVTLGTPAYMAPEQVRDSRTAGPAADLYSVGGMLYALLSGRAPFEGDSDLAIVAQVLTEHPPPLQKLNPKLPPEIYPLVDACLDKDVKRRPQSAAELRESLLALAAPDDAWLFARVRELTPTESKPSLRVPADRTPSRPSRSALAKATPVSKATRAQPAEPDEAPRGSTLTQPTSSGSSSKTPVLIAVFGSIIVACLVALGWLMTRPAPVVEKPVVEVPKPAEVAKPVEPVAPKKIELTLKAEPADAKWSVGEEPACNPCTLSRDQGTQVVAKVSATGFTETELNLDFDQARVVSVTLQPVAIAADPPPTGKPGTKPKPTPKQPKPKPGLEIDETNPFLNR